MLTTSFLFMSLQALALVSRSYQQCPSVDPPEHGRIGGIGKNYYYVTCDPGYIMHGSFIVLCENNKWDGPRPECIDNCEEKLQAPENGKIYCDPAPLSIGKRCYFECNEGYEINGPTQRSCTNYGWSGPPARCIKISSTFCPLPPPLKHGRVAGCSSLKLPKVSHHCNFFCNEGYVLRGPSTVTCRENGILTDENGQKNFPECVVPHLLTSEQNGDDVTFERPIERERHQPKVSNRDAYISKDTRSPCNNHQCEQKCNVEQGRAQCRCGRGYKLNQEDQRSCIKNARKNYASNPCDVNKGGCEHYCSITSERQVFCSCRSGYDRGGSDMKRCINKEPQSEPVANATCQINNGGCEHFCSDPRGRVTCRCRNGYTLLSDGKHCVDIDECSSELLNKCQHYCENTEGSYVCRCNPGYFLKDTHKCEGCGKSSYWSFQLNACIRCPKHSVTESDGKISVKDCKCDSGFVGNPGDSIECEDVNECLNMNFGCSDTCINIPGSAYCTCPNGFMLDKNNKTCIDIDECSIKNGGCDGICHNHNGSFSCSCPDGYASSNKDFYSCDDVDECQENNGGCEQICINYRGGYYCTCGSGFRLDKGLKNCTGNHQEVG